MESNSKEIMTEKKSVNRKKIKVINEIKIKDFSGKKNVKFLARLP